MRRVFWLCCFAILLSVSVSASDKDVAGKWNCISDDGHGAVLRWVLSIGEVQGRLAGEIAGDMDPLPLINPRFDGTVLEFKTFVNQNCTVIYQLTVTGNTLDGNFECPEVSGRMKCTAAPKI